MELVDSARLWGILVAAMALSGKEPLA